MVCVPGRFERLLRVVRGVTSLVLTLGKTSLCRDFLLVVSGRDSVSVVERSTTRHDEANDQRRGSNPNWEACVEVEGDLPEAVVQRDAHRVLI
jgi:hypothetical protein